MRTKLMTFNLSRTKKIEASKLAEVLNAVATAYDTSRRWSQPVVKMTAEGLVVEVEA